MNKILLAAIALLAVSPLFADEFKFPGLPAVNEAVGSFKNRLAPAPVDQDKVDQLFFRLAKDGPAYTRSDETKDGGQRTLEVTLVGASGPQPKGMLKDLVLRRYFSHLQGVDQVVRPQADGTGMLEQYVYTVSLDGKLVEVKHITTRILGETPQGVLIDQNSLHQDSLPPSDPEVQRRWKDVCEEFLAMGPTGEI